MKNKVNKLLIIIGTLVENYINKIKKFWSRKRKLKQLEAIREEARTLSLNDAGRKYYILYNHRKQLVIRTRKQIQYLQNRGIYRKSIGAKELMTDAVDVIQNGLSISERGKRIRPKYRIDMPNPNKK